MKYFSKIQNKYGDIFSVESVDDYKVSQIDIDTFTKVLSDEAVRKYITDQVMEKYKFSSIKDLAKDVLEMCPKRWADREELRFLIKNSSSEIVGMIGIDIIENEKGELWYFKTSKSPSFMFEATQKILQFLKKENIKYLLATVKPDNFRSKSILEKLGFKETGRENEMEL